MNVQNHFCFKQIWQTVYNCENEPRTLSKCYVKGCTLSLKHIQMFHWTEQGFQYMNDAMWRNIVIAKMIKTAAFTQQTSPEFILQSAIILRLSSV